MRVCNHSTFCAGINLNMRLERGFISKQSHENPEIALRVCSRSDINIIKPTWTEFVLFSNRLIEIFFLLNLLIVAFS